MSAPAPTLAPTFAALADPARLAIVERLQTGEATAGELAAPLPISAPAVSRHLKVLERAGLIARRVQGQHRVFRLRSRALTEIEAWLERFRDVTERNYERLDALLANDDEDRT